MRPETAAGAPENFPYVEPSQPPGGQQASLSEIPTVVGGKAVSKENATKKPTSSQTKLPVASNGSDPLETASSDAAGKETAASAEPSERQEPADKEKSGKLQASKSEGNLSNPNSFAEEEGEAITAVRAPPTVGILSLSHQSLFCSV